MRATAKEGALRSSTETPSLFSVDVASGCWLLRHRLAGGLQRFEETPHVGIVDGLCVS